MFVFVVFVYGAYLLDIVEVGLHALNGHFLSGFDRLGLKHF